jgi:hypothetical protein
MEQQLPLMQTSRRDRADAWRLDEATREAGRRGIEASRRALREATRRRLERTAGQCDQLSAA